MKKYLLPFLIFSFLSLSIAAQSSEIKLDGIFQGKNLYVVNPFASSGVGFCVYEVTVNGQVTTDEINSSAFEIDLSTFQFQLGDKIIIEIKHKDNCLPKVLNPEVLKPKSTFNVTTIEVDKEGMLNWTTTDEAGSLTFVAEQFRWNKWVKVGEVEGRGNVGPNTYSVKVNPHSGENKFRVKQIDYSKKPRYSNEVVYRSIIPAVTITNKKFDEQITFSAETMYEIYDYYGTLKLKGFGSTVDISKLTKGKYFVNFDNIMDQFKK
ncbi:MAG: hypothetical protein HY738_06130, partial [Bacteroidia bacterium]|nr:hypothetical protein [Bacteroidia bacterium]